MASVEINQDFYIMLIYRTTSDSNFTLISNDLINSSIPSAPKTILFCLLSKPANESYTTQSLDAIAKQLGLTEHAKRKALKWLTENNYLQWQRIKSGQTIWQVCDKVGV
jgi:hypothetical protein